MSRLLINEYLAEIDRLRAGLGQQRRGDRPRGVQGPAQGLVAGARACPSSRRLHTRPAIKRTVVPDGTILHEIRVPLGYWEAKDTDDDLDEEIEKKFGARAIRRTTSSSRTPHRRAVAGRARGRCAAAMTDVEALDRLLARFFAWERPEIAEFRKAVAQFRDDLPRVLDALREKIDDAYRDNAGFRAAAAAFLDHARETINPTLGEADVREMLIQHILTEEIFTHVFDRADFHRENNIAQELYRAGGRVLHRRGQAGHAAGAGALLRGDPHQRRADHHPPREAERSSRRSTRPSTRSTTRRPPTGWASSTRRTRSCASWSRAPTGSARSTSARR